MEYRSIECIGAQHEFGARTEYYNFIKWNAVVEFLVVSINIEYNITQKYS